MQAFFWYRLKTLSWKRSVQLREDFGMSHDPLDPCVKVYLLNQINASLQVHAKINEGPLDSLSLVFLLFQHEHVMVEELLKFLVREVDTQLLEAVELCEVRVIMFA